VRATTVAILAMGGEGGGVLADWVVDVAEHAGYYAQTTSVPGVAQRTGTTIYYLELFPEGPAKAVGKEPVLALMPVPGELDVVIASELMEAGRAVQRGLVTPERTTLIASTHRVYSMTERTDSADGRVDAAALMAAAEGAARVFVRRDFARIAERTGSVISAALLGALAATGALPFTRRQFEDAIDRGGVGVASSRAAFAAGFEAAVTPPDTPAVSPAQVAAGPRVRGLIARVEGSFPPASHDILVAAVPRLADYQDEGYAARYLDRLDAVRDADARYGTGDVALLRETGRYLALWMSYEDAIRVADLKIRRARFERVHHDSRAGERQVLRINEFLHPRIDELADVLPARVGHWLLGSRWAGRVIARITRQGTILETTSLSGFLQLYMVAGLRRWRRASLRFQREQAAIEAWLARIVALAGDNYALALEVAECARVVKGYGDTHRRGSRNFDVMIETLPRLQGRDDAARRLRTLREAALADDTGAKLSDAMQAVLG
jgi:indolepyruvate ferredoxin oxidoreductase, beta subunit